jgi:hypothetical protein
MKSGDDQLEQGLSRLVDKDSVHGVKQSIQLGKKEVSHLFI